jgi:hypothetical protein
MTWLYAAAILLGSLLLFLVQPMCAKMLLPLMGGTPAAWNTCMVFFQAGLLAGYAYAHVLPRWLGVRMHGFLHLLLLVVAFFTLPIRLNDEAPDGWHPVAWLLAALTLRAGLPFVLLAAGAPLVQRWFACRTPRDPYFLYAASNFGSFLALVFFPFVLEPFFALPEQGEIWRFGFLGLTVLLAFCVPWGQAFQSGRTIQAHIDRAGRPGPTVDESPAWLTRGRWIVLALIPSSLLLSVTTHLTTDIAAIPLLWLIPMGLYLLTFTIVFSRQNLLPHAFVVRWLPLAAIVLLITLLSEAVDLLPMGLHLVGFFWLAIACHGELSRTRPAAEHLTDFYLCLAVGGVCGGALNALLAPILFPGLWEYPLMIVLACAIVPQGALRPARQDWLWAAGVGAVSAVLMLTLGRALPMRAAPIGASLLLCYLLHNHPARFALCLAVVVLASGLDPGVHGTPVYRARSYLGIHRVTELNHLRRLVHGNIVHGQQSLDPDPERRGEALTYYSTIGPVGDIFHTLDGDSRLDRVGVVGLGTGSLAAYARKGQEWTVFEIDPVVERIADDPKFFTFLHDARARGGNIHVEIGDARLQLKKSPRKFGLLIVDAFGSDAIPLHLLTREALAVYLDHLEPNGLLAFHISNNFVELEPVLANLAADASCVAVIRRHHALADQDRDRGIMPSDWLVIARHARDLQPLLAVGGWRDAKAQPAWRPWSDDFSNLYQVFRWRNER